MKIKRVFRLAVVMLVCCLMATDSFGRGGGGRGGGGGGRGGGMGHVGGGGGRPSMGRGGRPSMPSRPANVSRPANINRPSTANISRPGTPNISRPGAGGGGTSLGNLHPSGGRPSTRPATPQLPRPGAGGAGTAQWPSISPPGDLRPATRPGQGGGGVQRPGAGDLTRPGQGGGGIQRPDRPGPDRPSMGDITRPGQGGSGTQWRPDGRPDRPVRPDRPTIGGGGDRGPIHIGDNTIINRPTIGNRPINNWGVRPGSDIWSQHHDWNNHDWADHWHDCIHDHHDWYHGCWNGHWNDNWYAPLVWGSIGWGLGATWGSTWGYGPSYYNPYYDTAAAAPAYDYSQPVVVQNYVEPAADATGATAAAPQDSPETTAAMKQFDAALAAFKQGQYDQALSSIDASLRSLPKDPVLHETRALCLFALGRYKEAAATLNSLLASAPGMDWTSMSSLYGNADDYTAQLRKLEAQVKSNPSDASALFVLAYHYLVIGQNDAAIKALQQVVKLQPKDATAERMLAALSPPETKTADAAAPSATAPSATPAAPAGPSTDLVGSWLAKSTDATVELTITEDSQFTWRATPMGKPPVEVKGNVATSSEELVLETKDQGNMVGKVKSGGPDKFTFAMLGMPPSDPGLAFERRK